MKTITLYIDFKSAASYLAMDATLKLINTHDIEVIWKPYQIRVQAIADEKDNETTTESHLRVRETQRQKTHLKYAGIQDKPMVFQKEFLNSSLQFFKVILHVLKVNHYLLKNVPEGWYYRDIYR